MKNIILSLVLVLGTQISYSQTYRLNPALDLSLSTAGVSGLISTHFLEKKINPLSISEIDNLPPLNGFDSFFLTNNPNSSNHLASDILFFGSLAVLSGVNTFSKTNSDKWTIMAIGLEGMALNATLTGFTKIIAKRERPFIRTNYTLYDSFSPDSRTSFYSGHTSNFSYLSFFTAKVLKDKGVVKSNWIWVCAASLPIIMGSFRMLAGKHYASDVIVGTVVGAGMGILIPTLHRNR